MPADNGAQFDNKNFYVPLSSPGVKASFPRPAETPKPDFQIKPGSEVYVRRSDKSIDGRWIYEGEDEEGIKVTKKDSDGIHEHVRHMTRQELEDLNRPTTLADIRGKGQKSIDDLVHVVRMLRNGDIPDPKQVIRSEDAAQMIIKAYYGEIPLREISDTGYLRQVLEHLMKARQVKGEFGEAAAAQVKPFVPQEDMAKQRAEAGIRVCVHKIPEEGDWVRIKTEKGFEGNWKMRMPNKDGTVMVIQIVDGLFQDEMTVPLSEINAWNS